MILRLNRFDVSTLCNLFSGYLLNLCLFNKSILSVWSFELIYRTNYIERKDMKLIKPITIKINKELSMNKIMDYGNQNNSANQKCNI